MGKLPNVSSYTYLGYEFACNGHLKRVLNNISCIALSNQFECSWVVVTHLCLVYISERECRKFEEGYNSKVAYKMFGKNVEFKKYDSCLSQLSLSPWLVIRGISLITSDIHLLMIGLLALRE